LLILSSEHDAQKRIEYFYYKTTLAQEQVFY